VLILKGSILIVALFLLLIGGIITAYSNMSITEFEMRSLDQKNNVYEISGFFEEGEKLVVKWWPADEWRNITLLYEPDIPYPAMFLYFNITGPLLNSTYFEVILARKKIGEYPEPYSFSVKKAGSLTIPIQPNNKTKEVGGVVNHTGNYTASIDMIIPRTTPPYYLRLLKGIPQKNYPYTYLLPVGITTLTLGVVMLVWYKKNLKKSRHIRK